MNYSGGKGVGYQQLINLMPPHEVYIETRLGGGAVIRHKRPALSNIGIERDPKIIALWEKHQPLDDAYNFLSNYEYTGSELVYCDPPYLKSTRKACERKLYKYDYGYDEHSMFLQLLRSLPCRVMISGYESVLYKEMLPNWYTHSFQAVCHSGMGTEWVWMIIV